MLPRALEAICDILAFHGKLDEHMNFLYMDWISLF